MTGSGKAPAGGVLPPLPGAHPRGATLVDTMVALGLVGILVGLAVPALWVGRDAQRLMSATRYVRSEIRLARAEAAAGGAAVGIRFDAVRTTMRRYRDGNGDGVRSVDIARGVDPVVASETRLDARFPGVRFALSPAAPPVTAARTAEGGGDAVRFGRSDLLSVTPLGTATPGTVYLRGRDGSQAAVRVLGATARVRIYRFDFRTATWDRR